MEKNVGGYDRIVRIAAGLALLVVARSLGRGGSRTGTRRLARGVLAAAGGDLLVTSLLQRCPVNALLGVNTCEQGLEEAVRTAVRRPRDVAEGRRIPVPTRS